MVEGFRQAQGEKIVVMDADLQHPPEKVPQLAEKVTDKSPVAVGTRYQDEGGINGWTKFRRTVSKGAIRLSKIIVPEARKSSDPVSGFFAVKKDRLQPEKLSPHGYKILLEVLAQVRPEKVEEVGYRFEEREKGESKLGLQHYIKFLEHAAECRLKHHDIDRYVDPRKAIRFGEFAAVGASGTLINMAIFASTQSQGLHYLLSGTLAFAGAVQWNFFWNWLVTFNKPSDNIKEKYLKFNSVSIGGFLIYQAILFLTIGMLGQPELLSNLLAIIGGFIWNFTGSEKVAFQPE
ncbi:glycosyltransferase [Candidatus Nanohaloarchaea archaeon]|nr:glycosyltransferase [Candidatus Nanohaloarchaea archaeon]